MYRIKITGAKVLHEYEELIKLFLRPGQYQVTKEGPSDVEFVLKDDKNKLKKEIYQYLIEKTDEKPPWGILTGIRPVKLAGEMSARYGSQQRVKEVLAKDFCVSDKKIKLAFDIYNYQIETLGHPEKDTVGIYIGIPFCPSRCYYCSFASNQVAEDQWQIYLDALHKEIDFVADLMERKGLRAESIYIGGGTPTTISPDQLKSLLDHINSHLVSEKTKEITLEAGRADTITPEKLQVVKAASIERISINPQTMKDETLVKIGRNHNSRQVVEAFNMAREAGISIINADLIAGLDGERVEDFQETLNQVLALNPENLTIHSLAVKRASKIGMEDGEYHYRHGQTVNQMLKVAEETLKSSEYRPYYLYRQKQMSGAQENLGYCRDNTAGLYNVRIMDEHQTIIALGAGGVSKVYYPEENRLERVPNVANYSIYITNLEEMLQRKRDNI